MNAPRTGFFAELKRRKVVRVAVVYAATGFVVLQVADIMLPRLGVPEWAMSLIVLLVALGFPVALVLAWALELTPEGVRVTPAPTAGDQDQPPPSLLGRSTLVVTATLVVLGAGLGAGWFLRPMSPPAPPPAAQTADEPTARSIAVLPFVNMSDDAANEFFADGISEELLNVLVRVDGIGVASRTSSFAYKGRELGAAAIASELGVNHILEGSVRKAGNRVRITAQLIDAVNDRHLWSETYDRELDDIFVIQDEIANAIVQALRGTLGTDRAERVVTVRADTDNLDAYELYLKARQLFLARSELPESVRLFERAVALDPDFARGWEGLAEVAGVIEDWAFADPTIREREYLDLALYAADRALALDSSLSVPWAARAVATARTLPADFAQGLEWLDRAIAADRNNASAYLFRSTFWVNLGFFDRALADQDRCLAIDPAYQNCKRWKALTLLFAGDTDMALDLFEQGVANGFVDNRADSFVGPLLERGHRLAALLLLATWTVEMRQAIIAARSSGVSPPDALAIVERAVPDPGFHSHFLMVLGAWDQAADAESLRFATVLFWDPAHAGMRGTPAFKRIVEQIGIPAYWREHGYPPQCRPVGRTDFECDR
jgi:adenylate cyclase